MYLKATLTKRKYKKVRNDEVQEPMENPEMPGMPENPENPNEGEGQPINLAELGNYIFFKSKTIISFSGLFFQVSDTLFIFSYNILHGTFLINLYQSSVLYFIALWNRYFTA